MTRNLGIWHISNLCIKYQCWVSSSLFPRTPSYERSCSHTSQFVTEILTQHHFVLPVLPQELALCYLIIRASSYLWLVLNKGEADFLWHLLWWKSGNSFLTFIEHWCSSAELIEIDWTLESLWFTFHLETKNWFCPMTFCYYEPVVCVKSHFWPLLSATKIEFTCCALVDRKKYPGMSPKMLARVGQWETATTTTPPQRSVSSGGRGLVPLASSTPSSNGDNSGTTSVANETKRYSFQPKTISPSSSASSLHPRSMSVETRPASARAAARFVGGGGMEGEIRGRGRG